MDHPHGAQQLGTGNLRVNDLLRRASAFAILTSLLLSFSACDLEKQTLSAISRFHGVASKHHKHVDGPPTLGLVPYPRTVFRRPGSFELGASPAVSGSGPGAERVASQLAAAFAELGVAVTIATPSVEKPAFTVTVGAGDPKLGAEGYRLNVASDGISIVANTDAGAYYGLQTLAQLASSDGVHLRPIPFVRIVDWPEYRWRGLHLDVSRHFFSVKTVEAYIDTASRFKLNTFHWHLTDDQGWRLEVPKYPDLTRIADCRDATQTGGFESRTNDGTPTCGYYTIDDVREVVAYAADRHVHIVPEIEGPGHSVEVLAAVPDLACSPGPYATLVYWGSTKYSVCPTQQTFDFYDSVFAELAELFPDTMIHIGGDEVPTYSWRGDAAVARIMHQQGITSYEGVQGYFTRRLEAIARRYGKRIVGWDEIGRAGTSRDAVIMAWTGSVAGLEASAHGNDVVMTPHSSLYFDAYQGPPAGEPTAIGGLTTLKTVYDYDPVDSIDTPRLRKHVIGAQANLWSEYIPTPRQLWYMSYPRALALAELCWTPRSEMDWDRFRLQSSVALSRLEPLGITFRVPEVAYRVNKKYVDNTSDVLDRYSVTSSKNVVVELRPPVANATIYYTLDGTTPTEKSRVFTSPLRLAGLDKPVVIIAIAALPGYRMSVPATLTLTPTVGIADNNTDHQFSRSLRE